MTPRAINAMPPIKPPTIAPIGVLFFPFFCPDVPNSDDPEEVGRVVELVCDVPADVAMELEVDGNFRTNPLLGDIATEAALFKSGCVRACTSRKTYLSVPCLSGDTSTVHRVEPSLSNDIFSGNFLD